MINFRGMKIEDLGFIYEDKELRSLITVDPKGEKFAIIALEDGNIIGGVSGYVEGENAFIQSIAMKNREDGDEVLDGLLRSTIHILELGGTRFLFSIQNSRLFEAIGFIPYRADLYKDANTGDLLKGDIGEGSAIYINLPEFFKKDRH